MAETRGPDCKLQPHSSSLDALTISLVNRTGCGCDEKGQASNCLEFSDKYQERYMNLFSLLLVPGGKHM